MKDLCLEDACPVVFVQSDFNCHILQQVLVMKAAGVVVMKVAGVVDMKVEEVVDMKAEEVVVMKEAGVEEGVMGVVGAEWVDVQGVAAAATRHDCKGCYCHSC